MAFTILLGWIYITGGAEMMFLGRSVLRVYAGIHFNKFDSTLCSRRIAVEALRES